MPFLFQLNQVPSLISFVFVLFYGMTSYESDRMVSNESDAWLVECEAWLVMSVRHG